MAKIYSANEKKLHYKLYKQAIKEFDKKTINSIGFVSFNCAVYESVLKNDYIHWLVEVRLYLSNGRKMVYKYLISDHIEDGFKATPTQLKKYTVDEILNF